MSRSTGSGWEYCFGSKRFRAGSKWVYRTVREIKAKAREWGARATKEADRDLDRERGPHPFPTLFPF